MEPQGLQNRGECEALRILRAIIESDASTVTGDRMLQRGLADGRKLLQSLRIPRGHKQAGRPATITTPSLLRTVARLDAEGRTYAQIAKETGLNRHSVRHHLKPSAAMLAAMTEDAA